MLVVLTVLILVVLAFLYARKVNRNGGLTIEGAHLLATLSRGIEVYRVHRGGIMWTGGNIERRTFDANGHRYDHIWAGDLIRRKFVSTLECKEPFTQRLVITERGAQALSKFTKGNPTIQLGTDQTSPV